MSWQLVPGLGVVELCRGRDEPPRAAARGETPHPIDANAVKQRLGSKGDAKPAYAKLGGEAQRRWLRAVARFDQESARLENIHRNTFRKPLVH